ncbi:UDP-3-O-acyl-N-acetylglucosamine deacetylase [Photobacterium kishitanii]|uniref:UDP-3-O-acyl-N-acetylglucosamine deacetylase n=1 Tax=Photobacterium kishitanii TaxID=318456 RepID=A0A2T3KN05_9GAMM|nr:UDP-3-O-acyl-N-acetylglucosamine deacetylase [Photobacterium kishitanii]PSV01154.1 UDP-3-O-[3-hydroxymyristoyl] N-acetylglucosamine deacetylase [Photobacterium kishitanii]
MNKNKTLKSILFIEGAGLHSGNMCQLTIEPMHIQGIFFKNELGVEKVANETLDGSVLGTNFIFKNNGERVLTVEHLLSTLYLKGITSAVISVYGGEVPILDGSGQCFSSEIDKVGITELHGFCDKKLVRCGLDLEVDDKFIKMQPRNDGLVKISLSIDFDNACVSGMPQSINFEFKKDEVKQLITARTFGFKSDIDALLSKGLCLGGSMSNAILFDENRILNPSGLRFENEIVSHKLLDLIGDLSPMFYEYTGFNISCFKPGHKLNNAFLRSFSKTQEAV